MNMDTIRCSNREMLSRVDAIAHVIREGSRIISTTTGMVEDAGVIAEAITMGSASLKCNHNVLPVKGLIAHERLDESRIPTYIEDIFLDATVGSGSRGKMNVRFNPVIGEVRYGELTRGVGLP